jgi:predicted TIM-barrel fold metal-dependent hydrolase
MIIDGHAYCFPPLGEANGFATREEHLRYLQREMADHHQPAWRLRDRAPGSNRMLADPREDTLTGLTQVNFRSGGYGRFVWTVDGEDYAKQYLPPYLTHLSHSPEMLVAQMDYVGIDRAVLHATPIMGLLNPFVADCVSRYPDRLLGLASIRAWELESAPEAFVAEVEHAYAQGLHGFQFLVNDRYRYGVTASWNSPACRAFWDGVVGLGKPIFFTISPPCPRSTLADYLAQFRIWREWLEQYPEAAVVLTHGFHWRFFREGERLRLPDEVLVPFRASSAKLELLFPIALGNLWDYPYLELHPTIVQLVETLGSDRLIWGTDMPNVERFCTYRQTLDAFRIHCRGVVTDADIANIIGGTVAQLFP